MITKRRDVNSKTLKQEVGAISRKSRYRGWIKRLHSGKRVIQRYEIQIPCIK